MDSRLKKLSPYLLILFGVLALFIGQAIPSGICFLIGVTMILERIWPEKWGVENENQKNKSC